LTGGGVDRRGSTAGSSRTATAVPWLASAVAADSLENGSEYAYD
jgi:hypothetical protein